MKQYFIPMILLALSGCQKPQSTPNQQQDEQSVVTSVSSPETTPETTPETSSDTKPDSPQISSPTHVDDIADWAKQLDEQSKIWDANNQVLETVLAAKHSKQLSRKVYEFYLLEDDATPEQIKSLHSILIEMNKINKDSATYIDAFHRNIDTDLAAFTAAHSEYKQIDATNVKAQKKQIKILLEARKKLLHSMQNSLASATDTEITPTILAMSTPFLPSADDWDLSSEVYSPDYVDSLYGSSSSDGESSSSDDDSSSDAPDACLAMNIDNIEPPLIPNMIYQYSYDVDMCYLSDKAKFNSSNFKKIISAHKAIKAADSLLQLAIDNLNPLVQAD